MELIKHNDPLAVSFIRAVQTGDLDELRRLLDEIPARPQKER